MRQVHTPRGRRELPALRRNQTDLGVHRGRILIFESDGELLIEVPLHRDDCRWRRNGYGKRRNNL